MSDNYLRLVSVDPQWVPSASAVEAGVELLTAFLPEADEVAARPEEGIVFYDAGANTETVSCPACGSEITEWWGDAMDAAFESELSDLSITTPCCAAKSSLNDLKYVWPAAFGRFALEAANPATNDLTAEQLASLERVLGTALKTIWQRL